VSFTLPTDESDVTILGIMASMEIAAAKEFADFLNIQFASGGKP